MVCKKNNEHTVHFTDIMHCPVSRVIQVILKLFWLKLGPYSFTKFLYYNWKGLWLAPFLQVKISVVNSAGGSFWWNDATDIFYSNYAGANICCNYAVLRFYCNYVGGTFCYIYFGGSFCCNYAGDCFCWNYAVRSFCTIYAGESVCSKYVGYNFNLSIFHKLTRKHKKA